MRKFLFCHLAACLLLARGHLISERIIKDAVRKAPPPTTETGTLAAYVSELLARARVGELQNLESSVTRDVERELYRQVIECTRGNQSEAARLLGVSRTTLRSKLQLYGLLSSPPSKMW